jgi:hypothetical protein
MASIFYALRLVAKALDVGFVERPDASLEFQVRDKSVLRRNLQPYSRMAIRRNERKWKSQYSTRHLLHVNFVAVHILRHR